MKSNRYPSCSVPSASIRDRWYDGHFHSADGGTIIQECEKPSVRQCRVAITGMSRTAQPAVAGGHWRRVTAINWSRYILLRFLSIPQFLSCQLIAVSMITRFPVFFYKCSTTTATSCNSTSYLYCILLLHLPPSSSSCPMTPLTFLLILPVPFSAVGLE